MTSLTNKKALKSLALFVLLWLTLAGRASTTTDEETMGRLTLADGLTGETVHSIITDFSGATWIATNGGVNAFNGKQLHSFGLTGSDGQSLNVHDLCEVGAGITNPRQHCIYAATDEGLWQLKHGETEFRRVLPDLKQPISLLAVGDTVYIGSEQGLMAYDGRQLKHIDVSVSRQGLDNIVRQYYVGENGQIWFLGRFDLNCYDPKTGKTVRHSLPLPVNDIILTQFAYLGHGQFVIGTRGNGLFTYHLNDSTLQRVEGVGNIVSTIRRSADGMVCVATDGAGAYLLEVRGEKLEVREHFSTEGDAWHRLPSNGTYCYYRDPNGVNWFGFVRYGLVYTYHSGDLFRQFAEGGFTTEGMNVRTGVRHGHHLVVGTQNGLYYVNAQTGQSRYYSPADLGGGHIVNAVAWYEGRFYIGTFDGGLHVLDPETQTLSRQTFSPLLDGTSIGDIKAGPDGRLWIGCGSGLMIVGDGRVQQHFTEQNSRIVGGLILSITFDKGGNAWVTGEDGCALYSVRSHEIVEANFPQGFFNRRPWMIGASGHDGLVLMRTGPQTFYTNEGMTDFGELKFPVQFRDKWCRSIVDDGKGHYIVASERGIFSISYDMREVVHFGVGEGLHGDFINDLLIDDDGLLWVATSQGLYMASLARFAEWQKEGRYKAMLFSIRRGSDLLTEADDYTANEQHSITLRWNLTSEVLQAEVMLMDYARHRGRLYEYRLDGGDWQQVDDGKQLYIHGLRLGRHRLEVRQAGAEGTTSVYTLSVVPSAWAVIELLMLLATLTLLWLWWRYRKNTNILLSERDEIEDALVESEELRMKNEEFAAALTETGEAKGMAEANSSLKYQKVKVDEKECAEIVSRMKKYIEAGKVYTNVDLKMKDIADELRLSPSKLSQVFNIYLNENYYDFINRYRLEEFKRLIAAGAHRQYTITALSEQCGFKKSNFFSTFRKVEGMTPAEYLRKNGVK